MDLRKLFFLAMLPLLSNSQTSKLEEKKGFLNYTFGSAPGNYKNLILELDEGHSKLYTVNEPDMDVDGARIGHIRLTFNKNRLSAISFETHSQSGDKMLNSLKQHYGEPAKKEPAKEKYLWTGTKMHLVYEGHSRSHEATVSFYNDAVY